jgi:hypothetical protein
VTTAAHTPSRSCYQHGCRLPACKLANRRYHKKLAAEHERGERRLHDTGEVRAHAEQLLANNWWQAEISRVSGVSESTISLILLGRLPRTNRRIALAILSIPITPMIRTDRGDCVDATGSIRRLRALATLGHSWIVVGAHTAMTQDRLGFIARGKADVVRPDEAQRIAAAYRTLSVTPGAMKQIATAARNKGWHGPLAWDDINNPASKPESSRKSRGKAGTRTKVHADPDRVAQLTAAGRSAQQIADELGCHKRSVVRARRRAEDMAVAA